MMMTAMRLKYLWTTATAVTKRPGDDDGDEYDDDDAGQDNDNDDDYDTCDDEHCDFDGGDGDTDDDYDGHEDRDNDYDDDHDADDEPPLRPSPAHRSPTTKFEVKKPQRAPCHMTESSWVLRAHPVI